MHDTPNSLNWLINESIKGGWPPASIHYLIPHTYIIYVCTPYILTTDGLQANSSLIIIHFTFYLLYDNNITLLIDVWYGGNIDIIIP